MYCAKVRGISPFDIRCESSLISVSEVSSKHLSRMKYRRLQLRGRLKHDTGNTVCRDQPVHVVLVHNIEEVFCVNGCVVIQSITRDDSVHLRHELEEGVHKIIIVASPEYSLLHEWLRQYDWENSFLSVSHLDNSCYGRPLSLRHVVTKNWYLVCLALGEM